MTKSVLLIGCGAIGREIIDKLATETEICVNQILVRLGKKGSVSRDVSGDIQVISSINEVEPVPDFVMECASHQAVAEFGPYFLSRGIDFGIISIGALSDPNLLEQLEVAARNGGSQLVIVPGAIGGIDSLAAASVENLEEVIVVKDLEEIDITKPIMSLNILSNQTIKQTPVLFGESDVLKTIQLLPGVSNAGEGTGGFYACTKYQEAKKRGTLSGAAKRAAFAEQYSDDYKELTKRYEFHVQRFKFAEQSAEHADALSENFKEWASTSLRNNRAMEQATALIEACECVRECRKVLQWVYTMKYYINKEASFLNLFEIF